MSNSESSTPRNFNAQAASAEDILKSQTVGLVHLDEFRKRRRVVEDLKGRDTPTSSDGALTPKTDDEAKSVGIQFKKKKRKLGNRGLLSFGDDEEDTEKSAVLKPEHRAHKSQSPSSDLEQTSIQPKRKFVSNPNTGLPAPKAITKASVAADTVERAKLRDEFLELQEQVRNSEIAIPFVFYDGADTPGGIVKVKKGEHIWLFLERCRKVGAEMGVGSSDSSGTKVVSQSKKSWARIGVDDLMLIRGNIIIPHHHEFYFFIANKIPDPSHPERLLFEYSGAATKKLPSTEEVTLIRTPKHEKTEGQDDDPSYTKVVDRRWYEKHKHIYPASLWKEYKAGKEFEELSKGRKDAEGNLFFFS